MIKYKVVVALDELTIHADYAVVKDSILSFYNRRVTEVPIAAFRNWEYFTEVK
jgi:hypothetical protein